MERWEEALDVDDSDLPSLLRPPTTLLPCNNRPYTNNPSPNPNPNPNPNSCQVPTLARCSQSQNPQNIADSNRNPCSGSGSRTVRLIPGPAGAIQVAMLRKNAAQAGNVSQARDDGIHRNEFPDEDEDFNGNPWLCALDFLGLEAGSRLPHTIESTRGMERVPQIIGIIKSCTSNGLGDMIVTLKDPTGTIGASIHRKVLAESTSGRDISVGSVVVLQQAVAFSPTRSSRYLNVTLNNVVKIISKNSGPPLRSFFPGSKVSCPVFEEHTETGPMMAEVTSVRKGAGGVVNVAVWRDPGNDGGSAAERRPEDGSGGSNCSSTLLRKDPVVKEPFHETCGRNEVKKLIPKVAAADWTDEQLLELFPDE